MSETETNRQDLPPELPAEVKVDKKLKKVKQSSITIFVVSIIALLSFGQPIVYKTTADENSGTTLNMLVLLTWPVAIYALFFLAFQWKRIFQLPKIFRFLGIFGSFILIANLVCSYFGLCPNGLRNPGQMFQATGPVVWNIDGKDYKIAKCYYLRVDGGNVQYTVDYEYPKAAEIKNDQEALKVALPIMKHICKYKTYGMVSFPSKKPQPAFIGVSLFTKNGNHTKGYRVALPLDEIKNR